MLEDCHWLDPLSHDLLEATGRAIFDLPVLILLTYRPVQLSRSQALRVNRLPHFTEIVLAEFAPEEAARLIGLKLEQFFGPQGAVPTGFVERITARAEGNPFYIEELLNYLQDRGADPRDQRSLEQIELPASLHSLILSRIDQLSERQVITLKVASVIGRLFRAAMLWGAYPQLGDHGEILVDLENLSRVDLMAPEPAEPELTYLFKHVITQEVTYESLPYATRASLHEQIGGFIETAFPNASDQYVDLLAFHFERSQNDEKKRKYLIQAGQAAQRNYANAAAIDYYRRALPLLSEAGRGAILLRLGQVLELVGQWSEAGEIYRQALELASHLGDHPAHARCQIAIGELLRKQSRYEEADGWLRQAQTAFEALGDRTGAGQALHGAGTLAAQQGDYDTARARYEQSLEIRRALDDRPSIASLLSNLGILARFRGDLVQARALHEEGLAIRRELGDRWAIANSLNNLGNVALDQGHYSGARSRLEEAVSLLREAGDRWAIANSLNNLGNVARTQGDYPAAARLYDESLAIYREFDDRRALAYLMEDIGSLAAVQGLTERALTLVSFAAGLRKTTGSPLSPAEEEKLDQMMAPARESLDPISLALTMQRGRSMTLEQAIDYASDNTVAEL
jgi:tetratricopeptide (TPR) repeat protein